VTVALPSPHLTRAVFALLGLLAASCPTSARAQPKASPPSPPAAPPAPLPSPPPPRASIARIAEALAAELARSPSRALVVAAPPASDAQAPRGAELSASIAQKLAGRRGAGSRAHPAALALSGAREVAAGEETLIHLSLEIASGKLRVTADVFPVPRTVWARIRDPEPGPIAHAFVEAPIDAEIRTFLAPVPLVAVNVARAQNFESDVVALACGDLDGDGATEILSVSRRRVTTLRLRAGKVAPIRSRSWVDLSPVHPTPLREPLGFAMLVEGRAANGESALVADVGLSDRAKALRLDGSLGVITMLAGMPVPAGPTSGCARAAGLVSLTGPLAPCVAGDPAPALGALGGSYDALAAAALVSQRGEAFSVWALRAERGALEIRDDAGHTQTLESAGAQLAVGDLDQDGNPEILSGLDVQNPLEDAVVVRSWARTGPEGARPKEIMRLPAAAGVRALAVCPPDGPGRVPFAVATADEIWVVR
jgi:hypothetical protein